LRSRRPRALFRAHRYYSFLLFTEMVKYIQPDGRRQIAVLSLAVDIANDIREMHGLTLRDLLQAKPESIFETNAGSVAADHDRSFDHARFKRRSVGIDIALGGCCGDSVGTTFVKLRTTAFQGGLKWIVVQHFNSIPNGCRTGAFCRAEMALPAAAT
jgi:hypothetical protein